MYFKRKHNKGKKKNRLIPNSSVSKKKGGLSQWEFDALMRKIPFKGENNMIVLKTTNKYR